MKKILYGLLFTSLGINAFTLINKVPGGGFAVVGYFKGEKNNEDPVTAEYASFDSQDNKVEMDGISSISDAPKGYLSIYFFDANSEIGQKAISREKRNRKIPWELFKKSSPVVQYRINEFPEIKDLNETEIYLKSTPKGVSAGLMKKTSGQERKALAEKEVNR